MKAEDLRKSILQLAIQGKLVPQDPHDEPASALLERICAEKQKLIKEGKIKKDKGDSVIFKGDDNRHYEKFADGTVKCIEDELPFEIPESWCWVRHNEIFEVSGGSQPPKSKFLSEEKEGYVRLYQIRDYGKNPQPIFIPEKTATKCTIKGDILLARYGASLGKVFWAENGAYNVAMAKVIPLFNFSSINKEYLFLLYHSSLYLDCIMGNSRSAQAGFNKEDLASILFPLPPLAEQARIVAEIERYEPLIAEYDKLEQQATKLDDEMYDNLKKSILQYAIQGKLVPQDPNDEPASVLLERIRAEKKAQLGKKYVESYIYKGDDNCYYEKVGKNEPVKLEDLPFDIPDMWAWARLKDIVYNNGQKTPTHDFSYIDIGSIDNKNQRLSLQENIMAADKAPSRARKIVKLGDILYSTVRPYLHNMCIIDKAFSCEPIASTGFAVLSCEKGIYNLFLFYYMLSPIFDFYANSTENSKGVAYPAINDDRLYKALIPIPPQEEQRRICNTIRKILNIIEKDEI